VAALEKAVEFVVGAGGDGVVGVVDLHALLM